MPAKNITVAGFSKGGKITLVVSSLIGNKHVNYVVLAGCIRKAKQFIKNFELDLKGRVLSLVDYNDKTFAIVGPCLTLPPVDWNTRKLFLKTGEGMDYSIIQRSCG